MLKFFKKIASHSPIFKYNVSGSSMTPTLAENTVVFVNRMKYIFSHPHVDDIVALRDPRDGKILIKRITKVEYKGYFVMGDNKNSSTDSRVFGMIKRSDIIGKVINI